jgi:hypothetical protein
MQIYLQGNKPYFPSSIGAKQADGGTSSPDAGVQDGLPVAGIITPPPTVAQVSPDFFIRINLPQLRSEDRALLYAYAFSPNETTEQSIEEKIIEYRDSNVYNGWQSSDYFSPEDAFFYALDALSQEGQEAAPADYSISEIYASMKLFTTAEVDHYLEISEEEFQQAYIRAQNEIRLLPVGSQLLIQAAQRMKELATIAWIRGISIEEFSREDLRVSLPGLNEEDYETLLELKRIAYSPESIDNAVNCGLFIQKMQEYINRYLQTSDPQLKETLSLVLLSFYRLASRYGLNPGLIYSTLTEQADNLHISLVPQGSIQSLSELQNSEIAVSPENMPPEIKQILQATGYWDLVRDNLREIYFTPEIDEGRSAYVLMQEGGNANPAVRSVQIDTANEDGSMIAAWGIAMILVHEAAHIDWSIRAPIELQSSTPDERNAYAYENLFLRSYISTYGINKNSAEYAGISRMFWQSTLAVSGANYALGYAATMMDIDYYDLPSQAFLSSRGLQTVGDLDMNHYPTDLAAITILEPELFGSQLDRRGLIEFLIKRYFGAELPEGQIDEIVNVINWILESGFIYDSYVETLRPIFSRDIVDNDLSVSGLLDLLKSLSLDYLTHGGIPGNSSIEKPGALSMPEELMPASELELTLPNTDFFTDPHPLGQTDLSLDLRPH